MSLIVPTTNLYEILVHAMSRSLHPLYPAKYWKEKKMRRLQMVEGGKI